MEASSLSSLLGSSWATMRAQMKPILLVLAAVALLSVLMQVVVGDRLGTAAVTQVQRLLGAERYSQLSAGLQVRQGASTVQWQEFSLRVGEEVSQKFSSLGREQRQEFLFSALAQSVRELLPVLLLFIPLFLLLLTWSRAFFLHLALLPPSSPVGTAVARATQTFLPLAVVYAGMYVLSFTWLPLLCLLFLGFSPLFALLAPLSLLVPIFFLPRFGLAPAYFVREAGLRPASRSFGLQGGIRKSLEESYRRTQGRWWKVVGYILAAAAFSSIILWFALTITDVLSAIFTVSGVLLVLFWIRQIFSLAAAGYRTIFLMRFSAMVEKSPKKAVKAEKKKE